MSSLRAAAKIVTVLGVLGLGSLGASDAMAQVTYTCAANVDSLGPAGTCATLNTSIAGLYSSLFSNANAKIYVEYGTTGLGQSDLYDGTVTYSQYVSALAAETHANSGGLRAAALASLPANEPALYAGSDVTVTAALAQALNLASVAQVPGVTSSGAECTLGTNGCYDAVVTLATPTIVAGYGQSYFYRNGTQAANAYDLFSIVEHETDEVLGTSSCIDTNGPTLANGCGTSAPSAVDLFRYSAPGTRSLLSTNPAYFSYNSGTTNVAFYTHSANHEDFADFDSAVYTCAHVQDAQGCLGQSLDITTDGGAEQAILNAVGYNLVSGVPETSTWVLLLAGLGAMAITARRRRVAVGAGDMAGA